MEGALKDATVVLEQLKAQLRARVEHPFRVLKCPFGFTKVRYRGLAKNMAQLQTLFALANLSMARRRVAAAA